VPEPWLRNVQLDVHPALAAILFALQQVREDLQSITCDDVWKPLPGIPSLGFHLTHIAGSLDRLTTYLQSGELTEDQLAFLRAEQRPGATREALVSACDAALERTEAMIRSLESQAFGEPRYIGRQRIPTTVIGLAIHIAEHTQRHCGQAITTSRLLTAAGA
jgi:uncharacterized damage-inducible protein DinB